MAGLDANGLGILTRVEIRSEIIEELKAAFGDSIGVSDDKILGRIVNIFSEREAVLWEVLQSIYNAFDPDSATGLSLDSIAAFTGTIRNEALPSLVTPTFTGTPGTVIPQGSQASVVITLERFSTLTEATLAAVSIWAASTSYSLGARITSDSKVYQAVVAGTSSGSGPTGDSTGIVDGTVTWDYLGDGIGAVNISCASVNTGPIAGTARSISVIETPIAGWDSVINVLDADLGTVIESDAALRVRRTEEQTAPGSGTVPALRTDILQVDGVTSVKVFNNTSLSTDAEGLPGKSYELLILGGADQDIWDKILESGIAGILSFGTSIGTSLDAENVPQTVAFSRPTEVDIFVDMVLTYDAAFYPADGDTQIQNAIVMYGDAQASGRDAVSSSIEAQAHSIPGVLDVSLTAIGLAPGPTLEVTIPISARSIVKHDTSRISITSTAAIP